MMMNSPMTLMTRYQAYSPLAEYTTELLNVLHVLAMLVELEPDQAHLLETICDAPTLDFRR